jgi:hypothetical protein
MVTLTLHEREGTSWFVYDNHQPDSGHDVKGGDRQAPCLQCFAEIQVGKQIPEKLLKE